MNEEQDQEYMQSSNQAYVNANVIDIRLNPQKTLDRIERNLKGVRTVIEQTQDGTLIQRDKNYGEAKANEEGVAGIMIYLESIINPSVVQGNSGEDGFDFDQYIYEVHVELAKMVYANRVKWGIKSHDVDLIINMVMNLVIPFISRTLNNEERKSYSTTIRSAESNTLKSKEGGFSFFKRS